MISCFTNQWATSAFHGAMTSATRFEAAKMVSLGADPAEIDMEEVQTRVIREWLAYAVQAGNA